MEEKPRVELPNIISIDDARKWCQENLQGRVKLKYRRRKNNKTGKFERDYKQQPVLRFETEEDAVAFKLMWL